MDAFSCNDADNQGISAHITHIHKIYKTYIPSAPKYGTGNCGSGADAGSAATNGGSGTGALVATSGGAEDSVTVASFLVLSSERQSIGKTPLLTL